MKRKDQATRVLHQIESAFLEKPLPKKIRILSMDGGGIYGYITALMLRRLCEENEDFLNPESEDGSVWLFAGTSAGGLNALMLASDQNPREVVLSGRLERFWYRRGTFANEVNSWDAFWSWFGVTAWLGAADFELMLTQIYGDRTLGDLPHRVLVTAFNWSGTGQRTPNWRPKVFANFPEDDPDREIPIRWVAYAGGSPPGLRAVAYGIGDGGEVDPDPSMAAITEVVKKRRRDVERGFFPVEADNEELSELGALTQIHMLSVGVCTKPAVYGQVNFNLGATLWNLLPTNPDRGQWFPPYLQVSLDGPTEAVNHQCTVFLEERFHRLDPPLLGPPEEPTTLVATSWSRFLPWQRYLLDRQRNAMQSLPAKKAVNQALRFLENGWEWPLAAGEQPAAKKPRRSRRT